MNTTPLNDEHKKLGAKMVWFAGWEMPIQYTSIIDEHMTVRDSCGAFDVSHMGDFIIRGPGAGGMMDLLMTNDVRDAPFGRCVYSHLLDERGRILDDTIASPLGKDEYFMVPNAATTSKMRKWVESHLDGPELVDMSLDLAAIAVQGPKAKDVVGRLTSADLSTVGSFWATFARLDGVKAKGSVPKTDLLKGRRLANGSGDGIIAYLSRTGYTGEDGFEIVCENADAAEVWRAVLEKGKDLGLRAIGLGARDTLRLEKTLLLSGTDFDGSQTSVQTGPSWVVDWEHGFMGKETSRGAARVQGIRQSSCASLRRTRGYLGTGTTSSRTDRRWARSRAARSRRCSRRGLPWGMSRWTCLPWERGCRSRSGTRWSLPR